MLSVMATKLSLVYEADRKMLALRLKTVEQDIASLKEASAIDAEPSSPSRAPS